ncbi:MAG TPA: MFS transporter [Actinomycetota bacterium]|nr:MFS transporter [Actinomycetota bacterium]
MTRVGLAVHHTFHAVGHSRNFRLFFAGQAISVSGTWMQMVAAAWLVLQLTGSGVALGIDTALGFGPMLFLGAFGGALADRHDKRRILIGTQIAFAALAAAFWALVATGVVQVWMVYSLSLLQGIVTSIDQPTRQSFFAEMVEPRDLPNAVSLNSAVMTGTRIVGPALAGVLIASLGISWCFGLNAISYIAVIGALLAMRASELRPNRAPREAGAIREGLRYAWRTGELRRPLVLMSVLFLFSFNYSVLMPLFAKGTFHGDAGTLGLILAITGVGSLTGALFLAARPRPGERPLAWAAVGVGIVTTVVAFAPTLDVAMLMMVPLGLASIIFFVTANSTLQLTARPDMRGRVMALYGIVFLGTAPIGAPIAGWVGQHANPRIALAAGGVIALVTGLVGLWLLARRGSAEPQAVMVGAVPAGPEIASA